MKESVILAKLIIDTTNTAVLQFGEYNLHDKGPGEVMTVNHILSRIKEMDPIDARHGLEIAVLWGDNYKIVGRYLVMLLDGMPDAWWDTVVTSSEILNDLY